METQSAFLVYWRSPQPQLFAFRMPARAPSARDARRWFRTQHPRCRVVGVKASSPDGRRAVLRGRWVG